MGNGIWEAAADTPEPWTGFQAHSGELSTAAKDGNHAELLHLSFLSSQPPHLSLRSPELSELREPTLGELSLLLNSARAQAPDTQGCHQPASKAPNLGPGRRGDWRSTEKLNVPHYQVHRAAEWIGWRGVVPALESPTSLAPA